MGNFCETFDIGKDSGSPVSTAYSAPNAFTGTVEKVTIDVSQISLDHSGWKYRPEGVTSAQLNMSYCVATMLREGEVFVDQFSQALVADPARLVCWIDSLIDSSRPL